MSALAPLLMILLAFFCGSLPLSVWIGKLFLGRDVRRYGDGNPGSVNVFRAGGKAAGPAALLLDISKAAAPVGLAYGQLGYRGLMMWLIAVAPILGHAFSPFLRFRGGKAIATAFGVWIGLTLWKASLPVLLLVLFWVAVLDSSAWAVMAALAGLAVVLALWWPDPLLLAVLAAQMVILGWKHRADLRRRPGLRSWLARLLGRAGS